MTATTKTTAATGRLLQQQLQGRSIAICGGGVMGLATAVHLGRQGLGEKVVIIERDASYKYCSALLSAGGVRQQFSLPENIYMSKYSSNFLLDYTKCEQAKKELGGDQQQEEEIAFKPHGYLFLASTPEQEHVLKTNNDTQRDCGVDWIHMASRDRLTDMYPWLNTEDLVGASYSHKDQGTLEGYFDPWGFMQCMKREALSQNVLFVEGQVDRVNCTSAQSGTASGAADPLLRVESIHLRHGKKDNNDIEEIKGLEALINTTGAWSREFVEQTICLPNASLLSPAQQQAILDLIPIERRKRCIFYIHCPGKHSFSHPMPDTTTPLTVDPVGVYFRSEGSTPGHFICGVSPLAHLDHAFSEDESLEIVDHHLFEEVIWPTLANRVPAFNELKVKSAWSGFYDYNYMDQNAIVGHHPQFTNLICAGGFSGHGLQMAPATGNAVAELLVHGEFRTIDLSAFSFDRLVANEPYLETGIV